MDQRALTALKGSIAKWEAIVAGTGGDQANKNCDLCKEYWIEDCEGCPISDDTGYAECEYTPYDEWLNAQQPWYSDCKAETPEQKHIAQKMLDYLKGLLPEGA